MKTNKYINDVKHRELVREKHAQLETLRALLQTWEPLEPEHLEYVGNLRRRVRKLQCQFLAMGGDQ